MLLIIKLKNLINVKSSLVPFIISVIILYIVNIFIANNFYNSIAIYKVFPIILGVFMSILLILFMLKKSKKKDG